MSQTGDSSNSASILRAVLACERQGWDRLCGCYAPLVYRWVRAAGLQDSDAQDVGQEVFAVVAQKLRQFRSDCPTAPFRAWLWGITRNKLHEFRRARGLTTAAAGGSEAARQLAELPAATSSRAPADRRDDSLDLVENPSDDRRLVLRSALELLRNEIEPRTWQVFWRTTVEQVPAAELAREMGIQSAAVRQAKYRVLRRLRQMLADLGEFQVASDLPTE